MFKLFLLVPMVTEGLLTMPVEEEVKFEICHLLHHLTDMQVRHQVEDLVDFSSKYCSEVQAVSQTGMN